MVDGLSLSLSYSLSWCTLTLIHVAHWNDSTRESRTPSLCQYNACRNYINYRNSLDFCFPQMSLFVAEAFDHIISYDVIISDSFDANYNEWRTEKCVTMAFRFTFVGVRSVSLSLSFFGAHFNENGQFFWWISNNGRIY